MKDSKCCYNKNDVIILGNYDKNHSFITKIYILN